MHPTLGLTDSACGEAKEKSVTITAIKCRSPRFQNIPDFPNSLTRSVLSERKKLNPPPPRKPSVTRHLLIPLKKPSTMPNLHPQRNPVKPISSSPKGTPWPPTSSFLERDPLKFLWIRKIVFFPLHPAQFCFCSDRLLPALTKDHFSVPGSTVENACV